MSKNVLTIPYQYLHFDPEQFDSLYNINRTETELRQLLAFSIAVAGKHAKGTANAMDRLLGFGDTAYNLQDPFAIVGRHYHQHHIHGVEHILYKLGFGCYRARAKAFIDMFLQLTAGSMLYTTPLNLKTCTVEDLEQCLGIGPKTARFFLLYTRPKQRLAALDTHIWKVVQDNFPDAPDRIPAGKDYKVWEAKFLSLLHTPMGKGMTPAEFDFHGWDGKRKGTI